jgi:hypothetical protein
MRPRLPALLVLAAAAAVAAPSPLQVRASPAVAPCVAAAAAAYERATGRALRVETAGLESAFSADGADVVVGADAELHRIEESGASLPDLELDVARIPWVLVGPPGTSVPDMRSLERSAGRVRVLSGTAGRQARRSLEALAPSRLESLPASEAPPRLELGEAAVVPLSLAGDGPVSSLAIPPLTARALGVRASPRKDAARGFIEFLAGEPGNAAFRACGRTEDR